MTPIPSGLARPLVESLEHDAVMSEHDIDAVIPPPPGGLVNYRDSVTQALSQDGTAAGGKRHLVRWGSSASK